MADARAPEGGHVDATTSLDSGLCHGAPLAADRTRKIIVSHPYDNQENPSSDFEVFEIDQTGTITEPGVHFALGPTTDGVIAMTPDGAIGIVAEDDGTLGVFRFDDTGTPHVVVASLKGSYYATGVVMDPSGARAYVTDYDTQNNGGGVYVVDIACDGTLTDRGLLAAANLPETVIPIAGGHAVVPTVSFLGVPVLVDAGLDLDANFDAAPMDAESPGDADVDEDAEAGFDAAGLDPFDGSPPDGGGTAAVLVPWPDPTKVLANADPFDDDNAILSSAAVTMDGRYLLIGDTDFLTPNRVGVISIGTDTLARAGVVENVDDPESLVASPFDDTVLLVSGFGNAFYVLDATDAGHPPFTMRGPLANQGAAPQLPGPAVMIAAGALAGRVLVGENQAIRQLQFAKGAMVTDLGPTATGNPNDSTSMTGAIGVQP